MGLAGFIRRRCVARIIYVLAVWRSLLPESIPLIVILGPTAIGKTALGVLLGALYSGEIISADSRQFYRYMNIGTAKPSPEELATVRHHLIDIADPDQTVGLAEFLKLSHEAITSIGASGKIPFLVGGTGQYIQALLQGWQIPNVPPDAELRVELEQRAVTDPAALWAQLIALDPGVETFIDPRNIRRVIRALEVCLKSQRPYSELRRRHPPPYRTCHIGLTADRQFLYARADQRVDTMMAKGLLDEVEHLLQMGYEWNLPSMSGLGYSQFEPYFKQQSSLDEVVERIKLDTHAFIRRQYTWFRAFEPDVQWFDTQDNDLHLQVRNLVEDFLAV
jgi:tRNA dimethylallyltransferase